jgi:hypothetical protein
MPEYHLGRIHDPETPRAAALYPVRAEVSTRTYRHWKQPLRLDQGGTGTCVGNAFSHRRAGNPVPIDGIDEPFAVKLYLEASAIYWGTADTSLQKGTSALSACQALLMRGAIDRYEWIANWNAGPEQLRYALLERGPLCVGSNWYTSMDSPKKDANGHSYITFDVTTQLRGGHEFAIVGIDLAPADGSEPYADMLNSWGTGWGDNGKARFTLPDLETLVFDGWGDAVLIHELPRAA